MDLVFDAFIGTENERIIDLIQGGALVTENTVTKAVIKLGINCLDTDSSTDPIELGDNNTKLYLKLGLWEHATVGTVEGFLVLYDAAAPQGIAWPENGKLVVTFYDRRVC